MGNTALHYSLNYANDKESFDPTIIEMLIKHGADPYIVNNEGKSTFDLIYQNI